MSKETASVNLIRNGDFSNQGKDWHPFPIDGTGVSYEDGCCDLLKVNAYILQNVATGTGGSFRFSVKMRTDRLAACQAELSLLPSGTRVTLNLEGNKSWTIKEFLFEAPADTNKMIVVLQANDGETGTKSSFDDVVLERR
ncbi:hypothetical protein [Pseudomonas fluorescens]|uniref:hypothetical protein n=1 Tax=Pseudomonas fluorescens TaxID=294 RepID=UPI003D0603A4